MIEIRTAHTGELDAAVLKTTRAFLDDVFEGDFDDRDWDHARGGMHVLAWEGAELVGHASLVQRRVLHGRRALRTGYVEAVGVRSDRRRRGLGAVLMDPLERILRGAYELGALGASDAAVPFYQARGWKPWQGPTSVLAPAGVQRTEEEDGSVHVLPLTAALDLAGELVCDWREGAVW
ncbi:aminoglycoside N-acetyltransferase AAC(2')-Ie [Actinoallomurus vinaceus]|uniref:Aminoglycoside N-acetyltransferase AAC(2')-Ie n=1 Tax=Actinoallomurus vinaceus TaxID=1080074 RepID=A0ABP8U4B1_9ACTN